MNKLLLFQVGKAGSFIHADAVSRWHISGGSTFW